MIQNIITWSIIVLAIGYLIYRAFFKTKKSTDAAGDCDGCQLYDMCKKPQRKDMLHNE